MGGLPRSAARPPWEILGSGLPPRRDRNQTAWAQLSNQTGADERAPGASIRPAPDPQPLWDDPPSRETPELSAWAGPSTQAAPDTYAADPQYSLSDPTVLSDSTVLSESAESTELAWSTESTVTPEPAVISPWDGPPESLWGGTPDPADQDAGAPLGEDTAASESTAADENQRSRHRGMRPPRAQTRQTFAELVTLAALPTDAYAVDEVVDGAICLISTGEGFEVFSAADGVRHEVRFFSDEEAAYFYLFGLLAAEAVRDRRLAPPFLP